MTLTIKVPETLVAQAETLGMSVETVVQNALIEAGRHSTPEELNLSRQSAEARKRAGASIRDIQSRHTLGGLKIKDLIEEGRRF